MWPTVRGRRWAGCILVLSALALLDVLWINKANQTYAKDYLNRSIGLSAGTYATCRIINGGVSSIQESSISISPWGIGIEYEAGQVLDPINDATERLSDACVKSMALLGVQRLLLSAVNRFTLVPFYVLLAGFLLSVRCAGARGLAVFLGRAALLLLLLRLSPPALCYLGTHINEHYFAPRMRVEQGRLAKVRAIAMAEFENEIPSMQPEGTAADGSLAAIAQFLTDFRDRIAAVSASLQHRAASLSNAVLYMKDHFGRISQSLAQLFALVIEKIVVQVFLLPLAILFLLKQVFSFASGERFERFLQSIPSTARRIQGSRRKNRPAAGPCGSVPG